MREWAHSGLVVGIAMVSLCAVTEASAQEFSLYHTQSSSEVAELTDAGGYGVALHFPLLGLRVGAGAHRYTQDVMLDTNVCISYERAVGCRQEPTLRESQLRGLSLTAALPVQPLPQLTFDLGTGVTLNQVRADDRTESGRPNALFTRPTGQWGMQLSLAARLQPLRSVPFSLHAGVGGHRIQMRSCGEYAWDDDPFCGTADFREIRLGGSIDFGR